MSPHSSGYVPADRLAAAIEAHRAILGEAARVAFVLPPGGAAGAYQAGALEALAEHGVRPDLIVGTSAGPGLAGDRQLRHRSRTPGRQAAPVGLARRPPRHGAAGRRGRRPSRAAADAAGRPVLDRAVAPAGGRGDLPRDRQPRTDPGRRGPCPGRYLGGAPHDRGPAARADRASDRRAVAPGDSLRPGHGGVRRAAVPAPPPGPGPGPRIAGRCGGGRRVHGQRGDPGRLRGERAVPPGDRRRRDLARLARGDALPAAAAAGERRGSLAGADGRGAAGDPGPLPEGRRPRCGELEPAPGRHARARPPRGAALLPRADPPGPRRARLRRPVGRRHPRDQRLRLVHGRLRDAGGQAPQAWASYVREGAAHGDTGEAVARGLVPGYWDASRHSALGGPGAHLVPL